MIRALIALILLLACPPLAAGLWDSDRPSDVELEDVLPVLVGRFDRLPPSFYEARHARLKPLLAGADATPAMHDDAAVALLRLGRHSDAIHVLDRKAVLTRSLPLAQQRRVEPATLANMAACLLARYQSHGQRRDLEEARQQLDKLLQLDEFNTDAEFARREVRWMLSAPAWTPGSADLFPNMLGIRREHLRQPREPGALARLDSAGAIHHLARYVVHGGGWNDPDVFYALSLALWLEGREAEAVTAWMRANELLANGAHTRVANVPKAGKLAELMAAHLGKRNNAEQQDELYNELRAAADQWVAQRNEYVAARMAEGRHPDTDATFWHRFGDKPPPAPGDTGESGEEPEPPLSTAFVVGGIAALAMLLFVLGAFALFIGRRHPRAPTVDEV